jgi:hypothetical protein
MWLAGVTELNPIEKPAIKDDNQLTNLQENPTLAAK